MDTVAAPTCIDVENFQFKLHRKIRAFKSSSEFPPCQVNLSAAASRLGVLFLGAPDDQVQVFQTRNVLEGDGLQCLRRIVQFSGQIVSLSLNCTQELFCVVYNKTNTLIAAVYDAKKFISESPAPLHEIVLSPGYNVQLLRLMWNPYQSDTLAVVTSDGKLSVYQCKPGALGVQAKPVNARCICWSPKGKQLVTGSADGSLCLWKPELTLVKTVPAPSNFVQTNAIQWLSNNQFCVVYVDKQNAPSVTIVNTPKTGNPVCVNYEDICYSMGSQRPMQFYLTHVPQWGVILVSSSNSMEVGVLGTVDQNNWQQWIQIDEGRAEMPLTEDKEESYPVGVSIDDSALMQLPWGENQRLPFMPMLHILSHTGLLITFHCINLASLQNSICAPPHELLIPHHLCVLESEGKKQQAPPQAVAPAVAKASSNDISFAFPSITSTPTASKLNFGIQDGQSKAVATKLFGDSVETLSGQSFKPMTDSNFKSLLTSDVTTKPQQMQKPPDIKPIVDNNLKNTFDIDKKESNNTKIVATKVTPGVEKTPSNLSKPSNAIPNDTIKSLYLKEINKFQMHLYEVKKQHKIDTQIGSPKEMKEMIELLEEYDKEPLDKLYSYSDVQQQITLTKQYLVKLCSVLIGAKLQPECLELSQLAQLDPISQEKMMSIKKLLYYVESQIKQITNVLDDQWNTFQEHCVKGINAQQQLNNGDVMKMPTLDQIYQPLVKHQDILAKQQATVKALQKLLDNMKPQILSSNNKKLPDKSISTLSSLTKNLLNLNIHSSDVQESKYKVVFENESKYTAKKYNALRDMLGDRHVMRTKPVKIELPSKLEFLINQEKLNFVKEDVKSSIVTENKIENNLPKLDSNQEQKAFPQLIKTDAVKQFSNFTEATASIRVVPVEKGKGALNYLNNLVSNVGNQSATPKANIFAPSTIPVASFVSKIGENQQSILHQAAKTESNNVEVSDMSAMISSNMFMGQKICSPLPKIDQQPIKNNVANFANVKPVLMEKKQESVKNEVKPNQITSTSISESTIKSAPTASVKSKENQPVSSFPQLGQTLNFGSLSVTPTTPATVATTVAKAEPSKSIFGTPSSGLSIFGFTSNVSTTNSFLSKPTVSSTPSSTPTTTTQSKDIKPSSAVSITPVKTETLTINEPPKVEPVPEKPATPQITVTNPASIFASAVEKTLGSSTNVSAPEKQITYVTSPQITTALTSISAPVSLSTTTASMTVTSATSLFGITTPTSTPSTPTTTSLFSVPTTTTSVFSSPVSSPSIFGGGSNSTFGNSGTTSNSLFGSPAASSLFASANASLASTGNMFESLSVTSTVSNATNVFGSPTPAVCASSIFGMASASVPSTISSLFGSASISTTSASSFGTPSSTGSIFGSSTFTQPSGNTVFGGSSPFGQPQSPGNVFGGGSTFGNSSFGSPSNVFGGGQNSFGSPTPASNTTPGSIFGGSANQGQSLFGSPSSFNSPSTQGSIFGGGSTFGSKPAFGAQPAFGSPSGFGSFSSAGNQQNIAQSGFGSPSSFGKPATFGGNTSFGSPPGFGSSPTFGGTPSFGGSPSKMFGSPTVETGFGGSQSSSTFENLATQSTVTFGNLAMQNNPPPVEPTFQSKSFTSWR